MSRSVPLPVVFVPGGVTPVGPSYAPLLTELVDEIEPLLKDLEVYAGEEPPAGYAIQLEVDALVRTVDTAGLETFHLVAFSGGGAVSLDFAAQHPERLRSLAIFEPANIPGPWVASEHPEAASADPALDPDEMLVEFTRRQLRPGVEPPSPPPGPPPDWMAKRPAGLRAIMAAFQTDATDREALRRCAFPVYLAYGLLTAETMVQRIQVLAGLLPDVWIEAYPGIHHFIPPQRSRPAKYAASLRELWARAERERAGSTTGGDAGYAA
jgi:pimeloyl-ACP methyl ester carboxylesterase